MTEEKKATKTSWIECIWTEFKYSVSIWLEKLKTLLVGDSVDQFGLEIVRTSRFVLHRYNKRMREIAETSDMYKIAEHFGVTKEAETLGNVANVDGNKVPHLPLDRLANYMGVNAKSSYDRTIVETLIKDHEDDPANLALQFKSQIDQKQLKKIYAEAEKVCEPCAGHHSRQLWGDTEDDFEYFFVITGESRLGHVKGGKNWHFRMEYKDYIDRRILNNERGRWRVDDGKYLVFLNFLNPEDMGAVVFGKYAPFRTLPIGKNLKVLFTKVPRDEEMKDWQDGKIGAWWRLKFACEGIDGRYILLKALRKGH